MAMTSTCPHCGAQQPVADDAVGKTINCKQCDRPFEVVSPASDEREPALGESARERASEFWAHTQPWLRKAGESLLPLVRRGLAGVVTVAQFYGNGWRDLWEQARESSVGPEESHRAEIRLSVENDYEHATWNGTRWDVRLPDQCVECGQPAEEDWTEEARTVPNLTWQL